MRIEKVPFYLDDLSDCLEESQIKKLYDNKMPKLGFEREIDLAAKLGISRQALSQQIRDYPKKFKVERLFTAKYVKVK